MNFGQTRERDRRSRRKTRLGLLGTTCAAAAFVALAAAPNAFAGGSLDNTSLQSAFDQSTFNGMVGFITFNYLNHQQGDGSVNRGPQNSFAIGGDFVAHSGSFHGFSVGLAGYGAQSIGYYKGATHNTELTGSYPSVQSFREAYGQYQNKNMEFRFGRQLINTPWANADYYTFSPRAFMGVAGVIDAIGHGPTTTDSAPLSLDDSPAQFSIFFARMFTYESRYSSTFTSNNRYGPANGLLTIGAKYQNTFGGTHVSFQGWYYDFYGYGQLAYGEVDFATPVGHGQSIFGGFQATTEGNSGSASRNFTGVPGAKVKIDAKEFGAKLGFADGPYSINLVGGFSPIEKGAFRNGEIVHPYRDLSGYAFSNSMQTGLEDFGPGYAYGIQWSAKFLKNKLDLSGNYTRYLVRYGYGGDVYSYDNTNPLYPGFPVGPTGSPVPNEQISSIGFNASYDLSSILKGLSITENTDTNITQNRSGYPQYPNVFFSSRLYLEYNF